MEDDGVLRGFVWFNVPGFVNDQPVFGVFHDDSGLAFALAAGNPEIKTGVDVFGPVLVFGGESGRRTPSLGTPIRHKKI